MLKPILSSSIFLGIKRVDCLESISFKSFSKSQHKSTHSTASIVLALFVSSFLVHTRLYLVTGSPLQIIMGRPDQVSLDVVAVVVNVDGMTASSQLQTQQQSQLRLEDGCATLWSWWTESREYHHHVWCLHQISRRLGNTSLLKPAISESDAVTKCESSYRKTDAAI